MQIRKPVVRTASREYRLEFNKPRVRCREWFAGRIEESVDERGHPENRRRMGMREAKSRELKF